MYKLNNTDKLSKKDKYRYLIDLAKRQMKDERDIIANLSNISAMLWAILPDLNWAGFYLKKGEELVLGPFQGLPACNRISKGKGVCGKCEEDKLAFYVEKVCDFPGHIACDSRSKSEMVAPILKDGELFAVVDLDSPFENRFDEEDLEGIKKLKTILEEGLF